MPSNWNETVKLVAAGDEPRATVRDLVSWFHARRRGSWIVTQIQRQLDEHGIVTEPGFESAWIDGEIRFRKRAPSETAPGADAVGDTSAAVSQEPEILDDGDSRSGRALTADPVARLGNLEAANRPPISVSRQSSVTEAMTLMMMHGYSQLPVMNGSRTVDGMVSWATIGAARLAGVVPEVVDQCMDRRVRILDMDEPLHLAVKAVVDHEVVLVRHPDRSIMGIVTSEDLGVKFIEMSTPFLLMGEIERQIRRLVAGKLSDEQLQAARDPADERREVGSVDSLSFGELVRILENPSRWALLRLDIDRNEFCRSLRDVARIRNEVMHFDPDGIEREDLELLRRTTRFLQALATYRR